MNYIDEFSEGEIFISQYLKDRRIKYRYQVKIENLKADTKSFRIADFYLPNYKVYIEFFGLWNVGGENRQNYIEKKDVYYKNNIPCVYLYPENLGIMDLLLDFRIQRELEHKNLKRELFKYRLRSLIEDRGDLFIWLGLSILLLFKSDYKVHPENNLIYIISLLTLAGFQIGRLYRGYERFFKNKRPINVPEFKFNRK